MVKKAGFVAAVVIALAAPALGTAAKDKPKPNLAVKKLFPPPAKANAGDSFEAGGRLVNGGERRGRATVKLTLRAELNDDPLVELGKIRTRVAAKRKKTFSGDVTIPAGFVPPPPGVSSEKTGLTLVACVRKRGTSGRHRCRAAKSQIMVEPLPVPPPSTQREPDARRPPAAPDRQRRIRRPALRHRSLLRPPHQHLRRRDRPGDDGACDAEPFRVLARLPGVRRLRGARQGRPGRVRLRRGRARPRPRSGDPADEARGHPGGGDRRGHAVRGEGLLHG